MNYYKESDSQLIPAPTNFKTPQGNWIMNFNKSPGAMAVYHFLPFTEEEQLQWRREHEPQLPPPPEPDTEDFDNACKQFRQICHQIGDAIGDPDFKGGFDEMQKFAQSPVYGTIEGLKLGLAWSAANENCKYTGQRVGLGQPQWWYKSWELQVSDSGE